MPKLSQTAHSFPDSEIRRIFELSLELDDVIPLSVGEPDLPVSQHILEAGARAFKDGMIRYAPNSGIMPLRRALAKKVTEFNKYPVDPDQIHIGAGGSNSLNMSMSLALGPGDEILVPDPGYATFFMTPRTVGATPVGYPLKAEHGFIPQIEDLKSLVTPNTKAILLNSPSNPLGVVFERDVMVALMDFAKEYDLWVISDEVYEYLVFDGEFISPATLDHDNRVLSVYSFSKTYGITGGRVGYLVTPPGMTSRVGALQEANVSCVNTPAQYSALAAVEGPQNDVHKALEHYRTNLARAREVLDAKNIEYLTPRGAIYLFINMSHATGGDVSTWAENFLLEHKVALAPGTAFGQHGEGWVRVCFAGDTDLLVEGLSRLPSRPQENDEEPQPQE